jgi:hypothetical protein
MRRALGDFSMAAKSGRVDANGEGADLDGLAKGLPMAVGQMLAGGLDQDVLLEGLAVFRRLEADEVVVEHGLHQLAVTGQGDEDLVRGPRHMQEEADPVLHPQLAQLTGQRDQVIVVHPDQVVLADQRAKRLGEPLVHPLIALAVGAVVGGQVGAIVQQRPERLVGVAVVIFVEIVLGEVDRGHGDAVDLMHV